MKATHKLVKLDGCGEWDLYHDNGIVYHKMTSPRVSNMWVKSFTTLEAYLQNPRFSCTKLSAFKGNK